MINSRSESQVSSPFIGILGFMSSWNFFLIWVEHWKSCITSRPGFALCMFAFAKPIFNHFIKGEDLPTWVQNTIYLRPINNISLMFDQGQNRSTSYLSISSIIPYHLPLSRRSRKMRYIQSMTLYVTIAYAKIQGPIQELWKGGSYIRRCGGSLCWSYHIFLEYPMEMK